METILTNPVEICSGSYTTTSPVPVSATSAVATERVAAAPVAATVSDLATETDPPKPYYIIQGMERIINMMGGHPLDL
jgi:prephenate dehydrogenase